MCCFSRLSILIMILFSCHLTFRVSTQISTWLFVITPLPVTFFWSMILLPSTLVAFISEASKFLIFDTDLCRNAIWFRDSSIPVPEEAKSCSMGETGWFCCAAAVLHLWALVCMCLQTPQRRVLSQTFGRDASSIQKQSTEKHYGVQEITSDDNDDPSVDGAFVNVEEGKGKVKRDTENRHLDIITIVSTHENRKSNSSRQNRVSRSSRTEISRAATTNPPRINTKFSAKRSILENADLSEDLPAANYTNILSPIQDGFNFVTDMSGACLSTQNSYHEDFESNESRIMVFEDETTSKSSVSKYHPKEDDPHEEDTAEVINIPPITHVPSIFMSPAMHHHEVSTIQESEHPKPPEEPLIFLSPAMQQQREQENQQKVDV